MVKKATAKPPAKPAKRAPPTSTKAPAKAAPKVTQAKGKALPAAIPKRGAARRTGTMAPTGNA